MKKFRIIALAFLAISFASCSSDDDTAADTSASILGIWFGQDVDYSGTTTTTVDGLPPVEADFVGESIEENFSLDFLESGEYISEGDYTLELTTTVLGESQTQTQTLEFLQDGTWSREGDVLIATAEGRTQEYDIEELTETTLIISTSLTEELGDPDTGVSIITMLDIRAVFSR